MLHSCIIHLPVCKRKSLKVILVVYCIADELTFLVDNIFIAYHKSHFVSNIAMIFHITAIYCNDILLYNHIVAGHVEDN